ncbi:MAG: GH25 family lysozyme [Jatrophihabitans sp.]
MTPPSPTIEPIPPRTGRCRPFAVLIAVLLAAVAAVAAFLVPSDGAGAATGLPGADVSHYQGAIDFGAMKTDGANFVYIKATEGTTYHDPMFSADYSGATNAGLLRGGYHFARPDSSGGASQANYFLAHGGGWSSDGIIPSGRTRSGERRGRRLRQRHQLCRDEAPVARLVQLETGRVAGRLGLLHVLAVRRLRDVPRRPGRLQRHPRPIGRAGQGLTHASCSLMIMAIRGL